ncbi:MAG TPA: DUF3617 family protein [Allosphingosinicella sp.]|nr:DUF3617 family protein [Allosphingosinicella sp.]
MAALPLLGGCGSQNAAPAAAHIKAGWWEQTLEIVEPKNMRGERRQRGRCVTPERAARPAIMFEDAARESYCTLRDFTMAGGRIHAVSACHQEGGGVSVTSTSTMDGSYTDTAIDLAIRGEATFDNGERRPMESRSIGRWVRDCRPGDPERPR